MDARVLLLGLLTLAGSAFTAAGHAADATVAFVEPQRHADAAAAHSFAWTAAQADVQHDFEAHLRMLAARLPSNQALRVEVLDLDLAGRAEPTHPGAGTEVRVLREVTWPHITLRYALTEGGRTLASGEERLTNVDYLMAPAPSASSDPLRHEKALLDGWFARRFTPPAAPAR